MSHLSSVYFHLAESLLHYLTRMIIIIDFSQPIVDLYACTRLVLSEGLTRLLVQERMVAACESEWAMMHDFSQVAIGNLTERTPSRI